MRRRAKIIATIGPASSFPGVLRALVEAGMDVARLNFSHGTHEGHAKVIKRVRKAAKKAGRSIAVLQDLQGPKIRTGTLAGGKSVQLESGAKLLLTNEPIEGTSEKLHVAYKFLRDDVRAGDTILLDDGRIELHALKVTKKGVETEVVVGGPLGERKGVNLPGVRLSVSTLSEKDLKDLDFGLQQGVDLVAISFVRSPDDMLALRKAIADRTPSSNPPLLIAKLERPEAIEQLDAILEVSDGVMVARGDLGVEVSPARVPSLQKEIIRKSVHSLHVAITATEMLESMIQRPRPTRAEASDVANAVFDGSDALMLSAETAIGSHPVEAVRMMHRIILDAESHAADWGLRAAEHPRGVTLDDAVATTHAARELARDRDVTAISVFTRSGRTARLMSLARPGVPILGFTPEERTYRQMSLFWGVVPLLVPKSKSVEGMIARVDKAGVESGVLKAGDQVVLVAGFPIGAMGPPNFTLIHTIGDSP
jgi:pyruvate kinase